MIVHGIAHDRRTLFRKIKRLQAEANQALGSGNLRNEQGQRNAATELCTAKQVEMFHFL
jgi:hypothetical protein